MSERKQYVSTLTPFHHNADTTQAAAREEMLAASALAASASLDKLTAPPTPIQEASIETTIPTLPHLEKPIPPRPDLNFKSPYFEIRASGKLNGGMGAFATRDIPVMTTILRENYLVEATDRPGHLLEELEKCTEEEKNAFFELASYDRLSQNWAQAIFLTNRWALALSLWFHFNCCSSTVPAFLDSTFNFAFRCLLPSSIFSLLQPPLCSSYFFPPPKLTTPS